MRRRLSAVLAAAALAACAGQRAQGPRQEATNEPKVLQDAAYFDVATCGPKPFALPAQVNPRSLTAFLTSLEPWVTECLVDERHRGPAPQTQVVLETAVNEEGAQTQVKGDNLTPSGRGCIQTSMDRLTRGLTSPGGGPPIKAKVEVQYDRSHGPSSRLSGDPADQFFSRTRLAFPTWCDCFGPWKSQAPRALHVTVALNTPAQPVSADVDLTNDTSSDEVAACLRRKMQTLEAGHTNGALRFTATLPFIHSGVAERLMSTSPAVQLIQLQSVQHQRAADVAAREGARAQVASHLDGLVKKSRTSRRAVKPLDLKDDCTELLKMDGAWLAALSRQLEIQEEALSLASELKEKDASAGSHLEKSARSSLTAAQAAYERAKGARTEDSTTCAKY